MKLYANIEKIEPQEDGTLKVYGLASSGALDSDGEIVSPAAMKAALPDYMKFGAVREMHQPLAAGTALEASVDEEGRTNFCAHVVDPIAVKKVTASVYKGFSIGGKVTERDPKNKKMITGLKLVEVSLVDRPANPEAVFTMYKAEKVDDEPTPANAATAMETAAVGALADMVNKGKLTATALLAAARDTIAKAEAGPRAKIIPANFKKGMGELSQFAGVLQAVGWLAQDSANEAGWEQDGSPIPAALRDWLAEGIVIFQDMASEEASEMLATINGSMAPLVIDQITSAASTETEKAGAKFSSASKIMLGDIHKALLNCCDKMDALGYKQADDSADSAAVALDTKSASAGASDGTEAVIPTNQTLEVNTNVAELSPAERYKAELAALGKANADLQAEFDALTKQVNDSKDIVALPAVAAPVEDLAKAELLSTIAKLGERLAALEAQPVPAKGVLRAIGKSEDVIVTDAESIAKEAAEAQALSKLSGEDLAKHQIAQIFKQRGTVVVQR